MPRRALILAGVLTCALACAGKQKKAPERPREILIETPDPVAPEDRMSADTLREPEPRDKGKKGKEKHTSASEDSAGAPPQRGSSKTPKTAEAKPPEPRGDAKHPAPIAPIAKDSSLGDVGLEIFFLDVGQANAILVVGPKASLLIDAGEVTQSRSKSQNFQKIAAKIYEVTGRRHLDYFSPSHYHVDHVGSARDQNGLWGLVDSGITIGAIVDRGDYFLGAVRPGGWKEYPESIQTWLGSGMVGRRVTAVTGSGQIDLGEGVTVEVVAVNSEGILERKSAQNPGYFDKCPPSENDYSIAFKITVGDFEFFTAGDLSGEDVERKFGPDCQSYNDVETEIAPKIGDVEVFKVTHHGSEHSNNVKLLTALDPEFTVIPSGGGYNHPAKDVAKRLIETAVTVVIGGFSEKEWPRGGPSEIPVTGDVTLKVSASGDRYLVKYAAKAELHRTYSSAEETKELDQKHTPTKPAAADSKK